MQNFGKIKNAFNDILIESIIEKNVEKRKIAKRFVKAISESKILKSQFLIYNNIEKKIDESEFSANLFVTENIKLLKSFSLDDIVSENKKLIGLSQMVSSRLDSEYDEKELHEAITKLIFVKPTAKTVQEVTSNRLSIIKYITENKAIEINENGVDSGEYPTSLLADIMVGKFNDKYADLSEAEGKVLNVLMGEKNEEARKKVFSETVISCIDLINEQLKTATSKEKLLDVKDKLLRTVYVQETFTEDVTKLLDLNRTLNKE